MGKTDIKMIATHSERGDPPDAALIADEPSIVVLTTPLSLYPGEMSFWKTAEQFHDDESDMNADAGAASDERSGEYGR